VQTPWDDEALTQRRTVAAVLRLVVSSSGALSYGEVVTLYGRVAARFRTWEDLPKAVAEWLALERLDE
jgi:hypothetical protein